MQRSPQLVLLTFLLSFVLLSTAPAAAAQGSSAGYSVGVHPILELLSGVLSHTSWIERRGPDGMGNEYYRALKAYLEPFKEHRAVQIAEQLNKKGFQYDAPPAFVFHLGPLPDLELAYEYSDYLVGRAGGRQILEDFREALADLARESDFQAFLAQWQPAYETWWATKAFNGDRVIDWLEGFFGQAGAEFHLVLAPAMFPSGGYGATVTTADGRQLIYQVVREEGKSSAQPKFQGGLDGLALHEWGHAFVNPALDQYGARVDRLVRFYRPVAQQMSEQAYSTVRTFMNEQVLRAVTSLALEEMVGSATLEQSLQYHEARGFYLTRPVVEALREYRANRERYPTFADYVPRLLERIEAERAPAAPPDWRWLVGAGGVGAILACVVLWRVRRRRADLAA